jgi:hypothetical protein
MDYLSKVKWTPTMCMCKIRKRVNPTDILNYFLLVLFVFYQYLSSFRKIVIVFHENPSVEAEFFHGADGQTDRWVQADVTKLIVAFRNFAKAPKTVILF